MSSLSVLGHQLPNSGAQPGCSAANDGIHAFSSNSARLPVCACSDRGRCWYHVDALVHDVDGNRGIEGVHDAPSR
jgi:hypothetical protein